MTIATLKPGDVIEVDKKGRRFHAQVREIRGRVVEFRPFEANISYRTCTSHEIIGIWKANRATRVRLGLAAPDAQAMVG